MIPLLIVVCIVETLGHNSEYFGWESNYHVYNVYTLISTPIYFVIFDKIIRWENKPRVIFRIIALLVVIFMLLDLVWLEKGGYVSYTMVVTLILHVLLGCLLLSDMAMEESREVRFVSEPYFWVAAGLIVFASGTAVLLGFQPYIRKEGLTLFGKPLYRAIVPMLNVVLYSCYTYAFYLCTKHKHSWQPSSLP